MHQQDRGWKSVETDSDYMHKCNSPNWLLMKITCELLRKETAGFTWLSPNQNLRGAPKIFPSVQSPSSFSVWISMFLEPMVEYEAPFECQNIWRGTVFIVAGSANIDAWQLRGRGRWLGTTDTEHGFMGAGTVFSTIVSPDPHVTPDT